MQKQYSLLLIFYVFFALLFVKALYPKESKQNIQKKEKINSSKEITKEGKKQEPRPRLKKLPVVNKILYSIEDYVITEYDLRQKISLLRKRGTKGSREKLRKLAIKKLTEEIILEIEAEKGNIVVDDERIKNDIKNRALALGISYKDFVRKLKKQLKLTDENWKREMRREIIRQQITQIVLRIAPPDEKSIVNFYRKNKKKFGLEFRYREIILSPKNKSIKEETRISTESRKIYDQLRVKPSLFSKLAKRSKDNVSPRKYSGGYYDYTPIQEIAQKDQMLASALYNMKRKQISRPFRNSRNQYIILKLHAKRFLSLEKARPVILQYLYNQEEAKVFSNWFAEKKKKILIKKLP